MNYMSFICVVSRVSSRVFPLHGGAVDVFSEHCPVF
jgi:hypothetical protein